MKECAFTIAIGCSGENRWRGGRGGAGVLSRADKLAEIILMSVEAEIAKGVDERVERKSRRFETRIREVELEFDIVLERDKGLGKREKCTCGFEVLPPFSLEFVEIGEQVVERAVLGDELRGGFRTDPRHTGHVVHGVAHEREHVDHLRGLDAFALEEFLDRKQLIGVNVKEMNVIVEELREVLVFRHDADGELGGFPLHSLHDGSNHVIRFHACDAQHRHVHLFENGNASLHLRVEILRRRSTIRLVLGIELGTERFAISAHIDDDGDVVRRVFPKQLEHHAHEPEREIRRFLGDGAAQRAADGVVGAEELRVAVDEIERGHAAGILR